MKIDDSALFFTCSLLELIGRKTRQKRGALTTLLGKKVVSHIYENAGVLHCEPIAKTADVFIEMCQVPQGSFDNLAACQYDVPDYWTIGKVYARLIEDVAENNVIDTLFLVYDSSVSDAISNYNSDFFYQSRGYIKECFISGGDFAEETGPKPAIRFAGFTDAWEQRKLGDVGSISMCKRIFKNETTDKGDVPFFKIGTFGGIADAYISRKLFEEYKAKYPYPQIGDILISAAGSIGKTVEFEGNEEYFQDSNIVWLNHNGRINNTFLRYFYEIVKWTGLEGSTIKRLYNGIILETKFSSPSVGEQAKIGSFFQSLDNLITLHQRKYDKLVNVKKSMLEKLFPKNGSNVPEIRFSGFTDAWEQRKLDNETTEMIAGGDVVKDLLRDKGKYPVYANALTNDGILGYYESEFRVKAPAVTVTGRGDVGHAKARYFNFTPVVRLLSLKSKHDVDFLEKGISRIRIVIESTGVPQLTVPQLSKYELYFPSSLQEEKAIGAFFRNLDDLITLHQRELEKLQKIKKSCLEKMFV